MRRKFLSPAYAEEEPVSAENNSVDENYGEESIEASSEETDDVAGEVGDGGEEDDEENEDADA